MGYSDVQSMSTRSAALIVVLVTVCALFFRVAYVRNTVVENPIRSDARQYVIYASNLVERGVFSKDLSETPRPDSFRSPGYPLLVALTLKIAGDGKPPDQNAFYPFLLHLQAVLGALMVPLTFGLGTRFLPRWAALVAATAVALSPHLVTLTGYVLTETLFGLLALAATLAFALALERDSPWRFAAAGALFGSAYLTNATVLFVPVGFAVAAVYAHGERVGSPGWNHRLRRTALFLAAFLFLPVAWSVRNALNVPEGTRTGSDRAFATMTHGIYPSWIHENPRSRYYAYLDDERADEIRSSFHGFATVLWERAKERPLRYASWFLIEKPYYGWSWSILQGQGDVYVYPVKTSLFHVSTIADAIRVGMKGLHPLILLVVCAGIPLCLGRALHSFGSELLVGTPLLLALFALYYTAIFVVFAPWPRYGVPLRPELYLLATWSVLELSKPLIAKLRAERKP